MRRRAGLFFAIGMLLALMYAPSASAQGATLVITPSSALPGQSVRIQGNGFTGSTQTASNPINIRLSTRNANPFRADIIPTTQGTFDENVLLPASLAPRQYLVIATQETVRGRQRAFTPGRAKLTVNAASGAIPPGGGRPPLLPPLLALLALALLAGVITFTVRGLRRASDGPTSRQEA